MLYVGNLKQYLLEIAITIGIVLGFTTVILLIAGAPPFGTYYYLFVGALGSWIKVAHVLTVWIPLTLCGCGLLYTFQIGLWNIGIEGQIILGAIGATAVLNTGIGSEAPWFFLATAGLAGIICGAVWALMAGFLKTRGGVNEIFAGLGMNFVAQGLTLWLIFGPWKRPGIASMSGTEPFPKELWLPSLSAWRISPLALGCAVLALLATALVLRRTKIGLSLRAIGGNAKAAYLLGLEPNRYMLLAMVFAGGMAGLAGVLQVVGVYHRLIPSISSNYGYLALLVVMLANYRLEGIPWIAFFFACLNVGSIQLPMMLQLDSSFGGVIQGAFVLTALCVHTLRRYQRIQSV
jgi:simple sugar transport system permease protein